MNVWRCWRTTRWVIGIYLLLLGYAVWRSIENGHVNIYRPFSNEASVWLQLSLISHFTAVAAWILGGLSLGRELADNSGAVLLSRPRSRSYFVWSETALVWAELLALIGLTSGLYLAAIRYQLFTFVTSHQPFPSAPLIAATHTQMEPIAAPLILLSMFLYTGLVYSVTYLAVVSLRRNTVGLVAAVGIFALYQWLSVKTAFFIDLPGWMLNPFTRTLQYHLAPHLISSIAIRIGIILLLTYASQFVLERVEIQA